ncbi:helix-turn-helix transcriptional regulator [[Mycoplasma] imitans]
MFNYAKKIKEYRERKFLTQQELAKLLGVTYVSICRWETGKF